MKYRFHDSNIIHKRDYIEVWKEKDNTYTSIAIGNYKGDATPCQHCEKTTDVCDETLINLDYYKLGLLIETLTRIKEGKE